MSDVASLRRRLLPQPKPRTSAADKAKAFAEAADANFGRRWLILVGLILAAIMEVLDTTIINVALPQMAGNLSTTTQEIAWVSTGYILANVVVLPMTGFLNARFGRRNYLTWSIILFTISSFFSGTSTSLGEIIFWRVLQGAAGAALISTAQATLVQVFPPREQGMVQPLFLMGLVVAPTIGPALGGWITDSASWSWCFFINVPIGILAAIVIFTSLHDTEAARSNEPVDWLGIGLLAVGLGTLQYVLEEGEQDDWFGSNLIVGMSVVAGVSLLVLVAWLMSKRNTHPVVNLRVLKNRSLATGIVLFIAVGFGLYGVTYLYPLLAQTIQGLSATQTGLALLPGGFTTALSIVFCGAVSSNPKLSLDARLLTLFGIVLSLISMWGLAHLSPQSGIPDTFWPLIIRGFSIGFLFVPINQLAIGSLSPKDVNEGAGLLGLGRQLGGSIGIAILATFLQDHNQINRANLVGSLTTVNPAFNDRLAGLTGTLTANGYSPADAHQGAIGLVNGILNLQAAMKSYDDTFLFLLGINVVMIPTLLFLRKPKAGAAAPMAAH